MLYRSKIGFPLILLIMAIASSPAFAQVTPADTSAFNAEFAGGGARALSMGGAFIGLGDDSTASEFNPAGLWQLRRPELALQVIHTWDERETGFPFQSSLLGERVDGTVRDTYWIPSFASVVIPTKYVAIGVSEFTNIYSIRKFTDIPDGIQGIGGRIYSKTINNVYGLTLATRVVDHFNIGTTVRYNTFYYRDEMGHFGEDGLSSKSWSANFGLLWKPHRLFQIGAVYKMPQKIEGEYNDKWIDTELPDTIGVGIALLPDDRWRILFDIDYLRWSRFETIDDNDIYRDDVWRYHAGAEWHAATWGSTAFFLRGGYMFEESNALRYKGEDEFFQEYLSGAESTQHYTFGFGIARPRYQFDVGVDLTEEKGQDFIASMVYYF